MFRRIDICDNLRNLRLMIGMIDPEVRATEFLIADDAESADKRQEQDMVRRFGIGHRMIGMRHGLAKTGETLAGRREKRVRRAQMLMRRREKLSTSVQMEWVKGQ
jgi:hypothetical protein